MIAPPQMAPPATATAPTPRNATPPTVGSPGMFADTLRSRLDRADAEHRRSTAADRSEPTRASDADTSSRDVITDVHTGSGDGTTDDDGGVTEGDAAQDAATTRSTLAATTPVSSAQPHRLAAELTVKSPAPDAEAQHQPATPAGTIDDGVALPQPTTTIATTTIATTTPNGPAPAPQGPDAVATQTDPAAADTTAAPTTTAPTTAPTTAASESAPNPQQGIPSTLPATAQHTIATQTDPAAADTTTAPTTAPTTAASESAPNPQQGIPSTLPATAQHTIATQTDPAAVVTAVPAATAPDAAAATTDVDRTSPARLGATILPEASRMRGTSAHRTLEIRLDPPDLGTVDLEIRSSGSTVSVVARTESAEAMLAVLRQRDSIEATLREHGMDLSGFDVSDGTPERDQADNRRSPDATRAATGSAAETADADASPLSPTNPEGSVFL